MATYEDVKDVPNHPEIYLIDVRNPEELEESGRIPASINIPLTTLSDALNSEPDDFQSKYGRAKPEKDADIIFTCRSGRRASEAEKIAKDLGWSNIRVYHGSWLDWAQREGLSG
ncbi:rhodanese domain-containing protein CG4456 [Scaptodrosophila lebanonensis]|uniref:Rhodanese domain-containing protein CG4456 n=1 Tax=Drosophila lebanonensis TaxID=7225 RepID=A0A6J2TCT2_DROLE|nr:rhodanese domain-containing protein CG4456 [Scaptodrosophila lebanonensis]